LIDQRKAASVLPEPVGAAIKVARPAAICAQPSFCGAVGPFWKCSANQRWTRGWNEFDLIAKPKLS